MNLSFVSRSAAHSRLILFFAGWGMDARPFSSLTCEGYNIAVVYDYSSPGPLSLSLLAAYEEICVMAWSFGVPYAARFIAEYQDSLPLTRCVAINGSLFPVDDERGIPTAIFNATINALSDRALTKFRRRMCGSPALLASFMANLPERSLESLADELRRVRADGNAPDPGFDAVYIADEDHIIPTANQHRAWAAHSEVNIIACGAHLVDFQAIISREFRNKERVARSFDAAAESYAAEATIQRHIASRLAALIDQVELDVSKPIIEAGTGTGFLARALGYPERPMRLFDIAPQTPAVTRADCETFIPRLIAEKQDAVSGLVSASTIQWFNSPARFISRVTRALPPGAFMALATFTPATYAELRPFQSSRPNYLSSSRLEAIMEEVNTTGPRRCHFSIETGSTETLRFPSTHALARHISLTGVNATQQPSLPAARALLRSGITTLTYQPIYLLVNIF
ncbi:MAG: DUF452 family protein [Pseudoflavonifractor sp.]|nr:DUF452 family protein [Pseudoflavonifractor sp.]